jgi:hypothetical protein
MPAIAGPFYALAGLPVSRADLFAHVIVPSLPIRIPPTPLVVRLPAPAPLCTPGNSIPVYTTSHPAHAELPAFPPLPARHHVHFASYAVPPTLLALPLHTSCTSTCITATVLFCRTHILRPLLPLCTPNVLYFLKSIPFDSYFGLQMK